MKIDNDNQNTQTQIKSLIKQNANKKLLFIIRFKLRFYNSFFFKKESDSKLRHSFGEPPVVYDSVSAFNSTRQMNAFLKNKGYLKNKVSFETKIKKSNPKKLKITYRISTNEPTIIKGIKYDIEEKGVEHYILKYSEKSLIKVDDNFDLDVLEEERNRITRTFQNEGFFFFSNDLIYYQADTLKEKNAVYITLKLKESPHKYFNDSSLVYPYSTYKIRNIYVRESFDQSIESFRIIDTLNESGYSFINEKQFKVRPKVISRSIFLRPNDFYILREHENTFRRISALNNYKYINISYLKSDPNDSIQFLDCIISLSPSKPKSFNIETNGTNTGGNLGINGSFSVQNRNAFKGAELLRFSITGGLEAQSVKNSTADEVVENTPFNTLEFGPEISLVFPRFLLPVDQNKFAKRFIPKTTISLSYNYQQRPDYIRNIINTTLNYSWSESNTKTHSVHPLNLSQIQIDKSEEFAARLDSIGSSSLIASYEDQLISSIMYNFVLNNQRERKGASYQVIRGNLELAGNVLYFFDKYLLNTVPNENDQFLINDIPYAQFVRSYLEYIHNFRLNKSNNLVSRTFVGVGYPYKNSTALPFVRSFYSGGTNGIRAWVARSIGPGNIPNELSSAASVDQIGDIKFEQNLEFRFNIFRYLEGALFSDIGNIWVFSPQSEYGEYTVENMWRDMAIGAGIGARLNFDFFIVRFDVAKRMKDPGATDPNAIKFFYSNPPVYNFAIGYPF